MKKKFFGLLMGMCGALCIGSELTQAQTPSPSPTVVASSTATPRAELVMTVRGVKTDVVGTYGVKEVWYGSAEAYNSDPTGNSGMTRLARTAYSTTVQRISTGEYVVYFSLPSWLGSYPEVTVVAGSLSSEIPCDDFIPVAAQVKEAALTQKPKTWTVPKSSSGDCFNQERTVSDEILAAVQTTNFTAKPPATFDHDQWSDLNKRIVEYARKYLKLPEGESLCKYNGCEKGPGAFGDCFVGQLAWKATKTSKTLIAKCNCIFNPD